MSDLIKILPGSQTYVIGEDKPLKIKVKEETGADISTATATCIVYASDGTTALASGAMTLTGTTEITLKRNWAPATKGRYRASAAVVYSGSTYIFEWIVKVLPRPAPN